MSTTEFYNGKVNSKVRWISRGGRRGLKAMGLATLVLCLFSASAAFATAGTATVSPTSGGSATNFNITLPTGAACSR